VPTAAGAVTPVGLGQGTTWAQARAIGVRTRASSAPSGPIREPWTAALLAGIALACDDVWGLLAVAVLAGLGLAVRIRAEERQLRGSLGEEYERFAAGRKRLVPGVW
jgi:protein-S-isoprenylcysteine O-methyltransferase Ste14